MLRASLEEQPLCQPGPLVSLTDKAPSAKGLGVRPRKPWWLHGGATPGVGGSTMEPPGEDLPQAAELQVLDVRLTTATA